MRWLNLNWRRYSLGLVCAAAVGCEGDHAAQVAAPAAPAQPPAPAPQASANSAAGAASKPVNTTLRKLDVRLSVGLALAQTTPEGTLMGFSVDYEFHGAAPSSGAKYGFMLRRGDGQTVVQPSSLESEGNLSTLVPSWRPEDGPFQGAIVELNANDETVAQSDWIELTGPSQ